MPSFGVGSVWRRGAALYPTPSCAFSKLLVPFVRGVCYGIKWT